jgi:hypothetical protein
VSYEGNDAAIVAKGEDETGTAITVRARLRSQPQAAAWIVREARSRVPSFVHVDEQVGLPPVNEGAGERLPLDPVRVVGRRCADSGTIIAYEPDGRVCPRCERVYHKDHLPATCACGAPMGEPALGEAAPAASADDAAPSPA